ncbi:hypothetical protein PQ455_10495 [Sphingomonas naphthae]|uniref:Chromosomal replication initiator DnaA C-terminal domain-containing protein n=1 Tax=Sphingomonas naphthae TaxID=1813468 RepID=A0ABY7TFR4_9SPHN|nr:hypothetical protein [Sphingomonas naphthae]WCT72077.1 hypothetical protein PQ455_10495 [Sphingomonas naphthae]
MKRARNVADRVEALEARIAILEAEQDTDWENASGAAIVAFAAVATGLRVTDIVAPSTDHRRQPAIVRSAVAWVVRKALGYSYARIGRLLKRDHTTIVYMMASAEKRRAADPDYRQLTDRMLTRFIQHLDVCRCADCTSSGVRFPTDPQQLRMPLQ